MSFKTEPVVNLAWRARFRNTWHSLEAVCLIPSTSPSTPIKTMTAAADAVLGLLIPSIKSKTSPFKQPANLTPLLVPRAPCTRKLTLPVSAAGITAAGISLQALILPPEALAVGGEFGILEGRTFALVHPVVMGGLFFYTLWAGYLGWQWRRVRTIQDEINELKKSAKPPVPTAVTAGVVDGTQDPASAVPQAPFPKEAKIQQLTEERKQLLKGGYRDRHYNAGSILLGFGVFEAVGGAVNTWFRTGKLFPGPHLFAGAGITILWALAAALVPSMQKGNETARSLHIALNTLNVLLFLWQIPTGFDILLKVFEFTTWP